MNHTYESAVIHPICVQEVGKCQLIEFSKIWRWKVNKSSIQFDHIGSPKEKDSWDGQFKEKEGKYRADLNKSEGKCGADLNKSDLGLVIYYQILNNGQLGRKAF